MNVLLWVIQVLLALHTVVGAVWKFSNPEQAVPSLKAIPHPVWLSLSGVELLCSLALLLPAISKRLGFLAPAGAACIAAEMLVFTGVHFYARATDHGPVIYWLVVAAVAAFVVYGRLLSRPL